MIWRTALRYAQFWVIVALASGQPIVLQKTQIVDLHNYYRSIVTPPAANMQRMLWDDMLSQVAANYAAKCIWASNPAVFSVFGENLFMTLGPLTITQPMSIWFNEIVNYNFNTNSCATGKLCGHYTQIAWANTNFVGCAAYFCPDVPNFNVQNATILVCYYYPMGNIMGQSPYTQGPACSSCPSGTIGCMNSTCDRGSSITSGITSNLVESLIGTGNSANAGSSAGIPKPSAAALLLAGLAAIYIRMT